MIEIIIEPDGSFLVPRGSEDNNSFWTQLLDTELNEEKKQELDDFFSAISSEIILNNTTETNLCG